MADLPAHAALIWLISPGRAHWWSRLFFLALLGFTGVTLWLEFTLAPQEASGFFALFAAGAGCFILVAQLIAKWLSEPVEVLLTGDSLAGRFTKSGKVEQIQFAEISDYQFRYAKHVSGLLIAMRDGTELNWQACYKVRRFQKMVNEFERSLERFRAPRRPPQSRR